MKKKYTNGYMGLLELLNKYTEFTFPEENPCDAEIIAVGKELWDYWGKLEEIAEHDPTNMPTCLAEMQLEDTVSEHTRKILQFIINGDTNAIIAKKLHTTAHKVATIRNNYKLPSPLNRIERFKLLTTEQLKAELAECRNRNGIAKKWRIQFVDVTEVLDSRGIDYTQQLIKNIHISKAKLLRAYRKFGTQKKVAEHFNVPPYLIAQKFKEYGIKAGDRRAA